MRKKTDNRIFKLRWIGLLLSAAALVFSLPVLSVWQHVQIVKIARHNEDLRKSLETLRTGNALLQLEAEMALSNHKIEKLAQRCFQMAYPKPEKVAFIHTASSRTAAGLAQWALTGNAKKKD